jgi:DNA-binding NarL/FixJ family response regulator
MKYPILHAERDFRFCEKLKKDLAFFNEFEFVDQCCYLDAALQSLKKYQPSILLTASKLYDETKVVEAFSEFREANMPDLKIIVLTSKDDADHFLNSIVAGVEGYISKSSTATEIYNCIKSVINGDNYLGVQNLSVKHK